GVGFTQEADDLFFGKAFLHVQSPGQVGLDSNSPCYSKPGGRRPTVELWVGLRQQLTAYRTLD
ncbi:hypothetical protein, partial [Pseudoxanthomonas japonensis]|uniref:hypothetical protein n=1 Tax=Pseudoxanthomonas japonensis TaxID=69284 RepID=UPI001BCB453F